MTKTNPQVSVVIPYYSKKCGVLKDATNSALNQTVSSIEVIVVDDVSPAPAEPEIPADPRVRLIKHSINRGGGIARNTGVQYATGDFIAFLDYDDFWYPSKLMRQMEIFRQAKSLCKSPVIYSKSVVVAGSRRFELPRRPIHSNETVGDYLFKDRNIIQTSGIFLERNLAVKVKFEDLTRHQDYQYCLALEAAGSTFHMLDFASYEFRQVPKLNDYRFSERWLETHSSYLSLEAIRGFKSLVILRSMVAAGDYKVAARFAISENLLADYLKWIMRRTGKFMLSKI